MNEKKQMLLAEENRIMVNQIAKKAFCKKPYSGPVLQLQPHLRDITLAPTRGTLESGLGSGFRGSSEQTGNSGDSAFSTNNNIFQDIGVFEE